jgi:diaminohydroxyphosphoribosylaminopyrimidine deaminase/5-amino-6-(5-phosphoribosylamino)uracil reductase
MRRAVAVAARVRTTTSPNPWVGCVLRTSDGALHEGATAPPGGPHAEVAALAAAGAAAPGATVWTTLEPCSHEGRTGPCADALVAAGGGTGASSASSTRTPGAGGVERLRAAGSSRGRVGAGGGRPAGPLPRAPHAPAAPRRAEAGGLARRAHRARRSSQWITPRGAGRDAHRLRARATPCWSGRAPSADDPSLTVRHVEGPDPSGSSSAAPEGAVHPRSSRATSATCSTPSAARRSPGVVEGGAPGRRCLPPGRPRRPLTSCTWRRRLLRR